MPLKIVQTKPVVPLLKQLHFLSPSRNYLNSLVAYFVNEKAKAARVLDAGAGLLRNYELFSHGYSGIGLHREELWDGLARNKDLIEKATPPTLYELDLNEDVSFLGPFCFCLCTATLDYTENKAFTIESLSKTLKKSGHLLFNINDKKEGLALASTLTNDFEHVYVIYYSSVALEHNQKEIISSVLERPNNQAFDFNDLTPDEIRMLAANTKAEMFSSGREQDNHHMIVFANNKLADHVCEEPPFTLRQIKNVWCKSSP